MIPRGKTQKKKKKKKKKKRKKSKNVFKALVSATSPVVDQGIRHLWVHSLIRVSRIIAMNVKHAVVSFLSRPPIKRPLIQGWLNKGR